MPKIEGWDKRSERRWVRKIPQPDTAKLAVVTVRDRRNMNRNHNWAVVVEIKRERGSKKNTIAKTDTKEEAMERARDWMRDHPNLGVS